MQPDANYEPNPVSSAAGPDPRVSPTSDPATRGAFHLAAPPSSLEVLRGPRTQGWSEAGEESEPKTADGDRPEGRPGAVEQELREVARQYC